MADYILIIAGDPSGDRHGALLVEELRRRAPRLSFRGYGGPCLAQAGVEIWEDTTRFSALGLMDVLPNIPGALRALRRLRAYVRENRPRLALLIDFGTFNLRIAPTLRQLGTPVIYYFPPGSWSDSWKRASDVAREGTKIITPFPQSLPAYAELKADAVWVGHPLVDLMAPWAHEPRAPADQPLIALLPGSRRNEIRILLPELLGAAERIAREIPSARFRLSRAPTVPEENLRKHLASIKVPLEIVEGSIPALRGVTLALATSGTVTLEAALMGTPLVVVYRTTWLNYLAYLAMYFPKAQMFAMPNILAGRRIVPELRQYQVCPERIAEEALALLQEDSRRESMSADLRAVGQLLGEPGAIARAAEVVEEMLAGGA